MSARPGQNRPPDAAAIRGMFDKLAARYDLFNHLTSMGLAAWWRHEALKSIAKGMHILDLGCGTGDLAIAAAKRLKGEGTVSGIDFSERMLAIAERRCDREELTGSVRPRFILEKAEALPVEKEPYDIVVSAFVLRNLYQNIDAILQGVLRSLKPGGRISFLDITEPRNPLIRAGWRLYMNTLVALYGRILFGADYPTFYLTESAHRFLRAHEFSQRLLAAGFEEVKARPFLLGVVTLYQAQKSAVPARVAGNVRLAGAGGQLKA